MSSPRGNYGGGYSSYYPSSSSFPDTPIYDSLVAERGTPQIAPIRVPSPYSQYDTGSYNGYGSNLPALPALPALPSGPSTPSPQYTQPQMQPVHNGYPTGGFPQTPAPYIPQQAAAPRGGFNGYPSANGNGYPAQPPQPSPSGYEAARPVPPRPVPPRQVPGGHPEDPYQQRRNLGQGYYQG
ncbi:DUF6643 family protein [Streptomyces sp. NPDC051976]|uniref:DUF6643 family protein n=1 Tax=Streptomyces sp. NPDC051976 TaxID=3154947 RepID=UPI00343530F9